MSLWFSANAVSGQFRAMWGLTQSETGWLTTSVQLGFVAGTALAAVLNLADLIPARPYFAVSALLGAAANAALVQAPGFGWALVCRFFTGFFLAGVYPPAMKMAATWFRTDRGLAIGVIVASLTVGKAMPYLVRSADISGLRTVVLAASAGAVVSALLVAAAYRDGPHEFPRRSFSWHLVASVARHRETRLATVGYLGHMWELYAMWVWAPMCLLASYERAAWSLQAARLAAELRQFIQEQNAMVPATPPPASARGLHRPASYPKSCGAGRERGACRRRPCGRH
jgi:hypothetical protein